MKTRNSRVEDRHMASAREYMGPFVPEPEVRACALGIANTEHEQAGMHMATIDIMREMQPPAGVSGREALDQVAGLLEKMGRKQFPFWDELAAEVKRFTGGERP